MMAAADELDMAPAAAAAAAALGPGFRFHPTDEELVKYYLERKVSGRPLRFDCIAEIDLYKFDPSVLPGLSRLQTRDLEWYFFTALDRKYSHGSKTNRSTGQGYWKTTGKDNPVFHQSRIVGMKKALVYHFGRAPHGQRTNWVMHEYRLEDENLSQSGNPQVTQNIEGAKADQSSNSSPLCTKKESRLDLVDIADSFAEADKKLRICAQIKNLELMTFLLMEILMLIRMLNQLMPVNCTLMLLLMMVYYLNMNCILM